MLRTLSYGIIHSVKLIRSIALLALLLAAVCGEAATIRIPVGDQLVDYVFNVSGIDSAASVAFYLFEETFWDKSEYDAFVSEPSYGVKLDIENGVATYSERYSVEGIAEPNNIYYQLIVDGGKMVGRLGESSDFAFTDLGAVDDPDLPIRHAYRSSATIGFTNGYIAPYHTGPDPIPEPTSGLLLLLGSALLALRRK